MAGSTVTTVNVNQCGTPVDVAQLVNKQLTNAQNDLNTLLGGSTAAGGALYKARAVATSIQAYGGTTTGVLTESSNGALAAQDGVTIAVGDVLFLPAGTANVQAADTGPWSVTALGGASAKWVLTRPSWWGHGATIQQAQSISVGGEGTLWPGSEWRAMCAKAQLVDTNDPTFYPMCQQVTTAAMSSGVSAANSTLYVLGASTQISAMPITPGGTQGTLRISTRTAGYPGTSSVVVTSSSNTDTSTVQIQIANF